MKSKILVSSILTIVLCFSLIVGSTFALFTSEDKFDISITSGKVNIDAAASIVGVYSAKGDATGTLVDENGATYVHEGPLANNTFTNGGTATINGADLVIERLTPGDKVVLNVNIDNNSNVAIQYRYKLVVVEGDLLASGIVTTVDSVATTGVKSYVSAWYNAEANEDIGAKELTVELPIAAGNKYQDLSVKYNVVVEAVQFNGVTKNEETIEQYVCDTVDELKDAIAEGGLVILGDDITITETLMANEDAVIDLNGNTITTTSNSVFQSQSNAAPSMVITSSVAGAEINVTGGDTSVLLGYGSTEISNVTININGCDNYSPNPFKVYGDLTLGEGTVVNVDYLGTALISNNGAHAITIDGAQINVGTFKTNGTAIITLNASSTLEIKNTDIKIDEFVLSAFGGDSLVSKVDGVIVDGCTFDVTDSNGAICTFEAKDGKYRLVQK